MKLLIVNTGGTVVDEFEEAEACNFNLPLPRAELMSWLTAAMTTGAAEPNRTRGDWKGETE